MSHNENWDLSKVRVKAEANGTKAVGCLYLKKGILKRCRPWQPGGFYKRVIWLAGLQAWKSSGPTCSKIIEPLICST